MNKPRWPWIVGLLAVVIVVVAVFGITTTLNHSATTPTSGPTTTQTSTAAPDAAPTGCLGGTNRDNTMLLTAQKEAPHSTTGAIEVAAALVRWTFRSPLFSVADANEISSKVISKGATADFRNLATAAANNQNNSGGVVADGTSFYLSTANGVWHIESTSPDKVTVSIGAVYVIGGAVSPQLRSSTTVAMVWEDGSWRALSGSITRTTEELFRIGTPFTKGC